MQRLRFDEEQADGGENKERNQFGYRKGGANPGSLANASYVDPRVCEHHHANGACAGKRLNELRPQHRSVVNQKI